LSGCTKKKKLSGNLFGPHQTQNMINIISNLYLTLLSYHTLSFFYHQKIERNHKKNIAAWKFSVDFWREIPIEIFFFWLDWWAFSF